MKTKRQKKMKEDERKTKKRCWIVTDLLDINNENSEHEWNLLVPRHWRNLSLFHYLKDSYSPLLPITTKDSQYYAKSISSVSDMVCSPECAVI